MSLMSRRALLLVLAALALAVPAYASAASLPTFYQYGSHCKKRSCTSSAYTDSKSKQVFSFYVTAKCKQKNQTVPVSIYNAAKIKKKKFSVTQAVSTYDPKTNESTPGTITISGKVKARKKIYGKWKVDKVAAGCEKVAKGSFSLKYKGKVSGGG